MGRSIIKKPRDWTQGRGAGLTAFLAQRRVTSTCAPLLEQGSQQKGITVSSVDVPRFVRPKGIRYYVSGLWRSSSPSNQLVPRLSPELVLAKAQEHKNTLADVEKYLKRRGLGEAFGQIRADILCEKQYFKDEDAHEKFKSLYQRMPNDKTRILLLVLQLQSVAEMHATGFPEFVELIDHNFELIREKDLEDVFSSYKRAADLPSRNGVLIELRALSLLRTLPFVNHIIYRPVIDGQEIDLHFRVGMTWVIAEVKTKKSAVKSSQKVNYRSIANFYRFQFIFIFGEDKKGVESVTLSELAVMRTETDFWSALMSIPKVTATVASEGKRSNADNSISPTESELRYAQLQRDFLAAIADHPALYIDEGPSQSIDKTTGLKMYVGKKSYQVIMITTVKPRKLGLMLLNLGEQPPDSVIYIVPFSPEIPGSYLTIDEIRATQSADEVQALLEAHRRFTPEMVRSPIPNRLADGGLATIRDLSVILRRFSGVKSNLTEDDQEKVWRWLAEDEELVAERVRYLIDTHDENYLQNAGIL